MTDNADNTSQGSQMICMKYNRTMAQDHMACRDPHIHCKFRSACPIWFITRKGGRDIDGDIGNQVSAA